MLLKVLYLSYIETVGFILGKCVFITAATILLNSGSPISLTVVRQKPGVLLVNNKSIDEGLFYLLNKWGVSLGYAIWTFHKQQS